MRWESLVAVGAAVGITVAACGSSSESTFFEGGGDAGGETPASQGPFAPSTPTGDGGSGIPGCTPKTCGDTNANCGPIGDGCGGIVDCGSTCPTGETCGGAGEPSRCGKPACVAKTCAQLGVECGPAGDGCGGLIASCGSCEAGTCGGGGPSKCGGAGGNPDGGACVPTKTACAPGDCGPISDGCGALLNCPTTCPAGETCGAGGTPSVCGKPACTKANCGTANCGYKADGCGGILNCWPAGGPAICGPGETCGGGGAANVCGTPAGCTGLCLQQQQCAGGGTTTIEGYVTSPNGVLPVPNAVVYVPNGAVAAFTQGVTCESCATASGNPLVTTTTNANGYFLLSNVPVSTAGKVVDIPVVVQLGRWRKQFTIQTTACTSNKVPAVGAAAANKTAALPASQAEGDIPLTAISTGAVDGLECVFRKMGVADSEFTNGMGTGRIRLYQDDSADPNLPYGGACAPGCGADCASSGTASCPEASKLYGRYKGSGGVSDATNATPIRIRTSNNHGLATGDVVTISGVVGNTAANGTWTITRIDGDDFTLNGSAGNGAYAGSNGDAWSSCGTQACNAEIEKFDAVIFGCVGAPDHKPVEARTNVIDYANKGGRVFATHFSYVWLYSTGNPSFTSPWDGTANAWTPGSRMWNSATAFLDTSFPKGVLFSNWLQAPVGAQPASYPAPYSPVNALSQTSPPMVSIQEPRRDITPTSPNTATSGVVPPGQRWIYTTSAGSTFSGDTAADAPLHYTFNTPSGAPAANQCGRVLFSDFHVSIGVTAERVFPAECNNDPLTAQEKILAYMLFDLASCVSTTAPPACVPKTCMQQGIGCGPAGDGCGGLIQCGDCPSGQTCGGGGVPNQCGAPACTPKTCQTGQCGLMGNGCGGALDCGDCPAGQVCGGGGANLCGTAACTPSSCPTPAAGSQCGPVANGCGAVINCPCPANMPCVNGTCGAPQCTPRTCQQAGANCGTIADGCGGTQFCGDCIAPQTCGGSGTPNVCGGGVN